MECRRIRCGNVNCYLLSQNGRGILVDAGGRGYEGKIRRECKKAGVEMQLVFLTHGHVDHIYNAAALAAGWGVPIAMNGKDTGLITDQLSQPIRTEGLQGLALGIASRRLMERTKIPAFRPDILLEEGGSLREFGFDAQVIALPGHTAGSVGLDVEGRLLFVGDAMMNFFRPECPCLFADREETERSVRRIRALGRRTLYFGHGRPQQYCP